MKVQMRKTKDGKGYLFSWLNQIAKPTNTLYPQTTKQAATFPARQSCHMKANQSTHNLQASEKYSLVGLGGNPQK